MVNIITHELLKSWEPCIDGYKRFCELFPDGADLKTAVEGLVSDGHDSWGHWLFMRCKEKQLFSEYTDKGYMNTGNMNTGYMNTGGRNTGNMNTGDMNTEDRNTGNMNTGYMNTGGRNTGDWNTGYMNTGDMNTGDWNKASYQTGFFNTITPEVIMVFNKPYARQGFLDADKPDFIYTVNPNIWIYESEMSDEEKEANPNFYVQGGFLKSIPMQEAWKKAWDESTDDDRAKVKLLPNFDADVFFEITGIRVE